MLRRPARPPKRLRNIVVFGDTGCRILGTEVQNCSSTAGWPLARISADITGRRPYLVMFVGDFYSREAPCPADKQVECGSSPSLRPGTISRTDADNHCRSLRGSVYPA